MAPAGLTRLCREAGCIRVSHGLHHKPLFFVGKDGFEERKQREPRRNSGQLIYSVSFPLLGLTILGNYFY